MSTTRRVIIGLGNPGDEYANTYHNVGKLFIDFACARKELVLSEPSHKHFMFAASGTDVFAVPLSFMNTSGQPAHEILQFFDVTPANVMIVHDDSDLPLGTFKVTLGGGSAGHHGLDSLFEAFGTQEFYRIRIGIRNPDEQVRQKAGDFVLRKISAMDKEKLYGVFEEIMVNVIEKVTP